MTFHPHIHSRLFNTPLMIVPEKGAQIAQAVVTHGDANAPRLELDANAAAILEAFEGRVGASRFVGSDVETGDGGRRNVVLPYRRTANGIGVLTIVGSLVNRGAWLNAKSGLTSYEGIKFQIESLAADPKVKAVILDLESPGGEASGCFETAAAVRALAAQKPVTAVINGMACSAAYAIASAARSIVSTPTGVSGSIGVVLMHVDYSGAMDKAGIKATFIHAGAHKVDGNPYQPLSKGVRSDLQAEVDAYYDLFVETVARGRKGLSAAAIRGTEGRTFIGADAKARGLVDDIATFDDVIAGRDFSRSYVPGAALARPASATGSALLPHSQAIAQAIARASATLAGTPGAGGVDLTSSANARAIAVATALAHAGAGAPGGPLADGPARAVDAGSFTPAPRQAGAVPWSDIADEMNAKMGVEAPGRRAGVEPVARQRLPVPKQAGAVSWSDIADKLNAELNSAPSARHAGSGLAARDAETARSFGQSGAPAQAGAVPWAEIAARLNAEKGVKAPARR